MGMDLNVNYISASRAGMFENCKYQFYLDVIKYGHDQYSNDESATDDEINDPVYLIFGKVMHKTLELFWKGKKRDKKTLFRLFRENYVSYALNNKYYYELGHEMLSLYVHYLKYDAPRRKFIGAELFFDFLLDETKTSENYKVDEKGNIIDLRPRAKGTIDSIYYLGNGIYEINDYKTSNWLPSQEDVDANIQMALYDLAFMEAPCLKKYYYHGIEPKAIILVMHYLRFEEGVIKTQISKREREINKQFFIDTFYQMNSMKTDQFNSELNNFCCFCGYCEECGAYNSALQEDIFVLNNKKDFKSCIKNIDELKARIKILNAKLAEQNSKCMSYFRKEKHNIVQVGDREYYTTNYTKRYLLPTVAMKILKENDLWNTKDMIEDIPVGKVEKLCKDYPEVWEKIQRKALKRYVGNEMLKSRKIPKYKLK
jgi:hypothetical protein